MVRDMATGWTETPSPEPNSWSTSPGEDTACIAKPRRFKYPICPRRKFKVSGIVTTCTRRILSSSLVPAHDCFTISPVKIERNANCGALASDFGLNLSTFLGQPFLGYLFHFVIEFNSARLQGIIMVFFGLLPVAAGHPGETLLVTHHFHDFPG